MMTYQEAAEVAKNETPDGWYVDPEAMLALSEFAWEQEKFEGVPQLTTYRNAWRKANEVWKASGSICHAAEMVAIEHEVAAMKIGA